MNRAEGDMAEKCEAMDESRGQRDEISQCLIESGMELTECKE